MDRTTCRSRPFSTIPSPGSGGIAMTAWPVPPAARHLRVRACGTPLDRCAGGRARCGQPVAYRVQGVPHLRRRILRPKFHRHRGAQHDHPQGVRTALDGVSPAVRLEAAGGPVRADRDDGGLTQDRSPGVRRGGAGPNAGRVTDLVLPRLEAHRRRGPCGDRAAAHQRNHSVRASQGPASGRARVGPDAGSQRRPLVQRLQRVAACGRVAQTRGPQVVAALSFVSSNLKAKHARSSASR
jgi:hypothetical protein